MAAPAPSSTAAAAEAAGGAGPSFSVVTDDAVVASKLNELRARLGRVYSAITSTDPIPEFNARNAPQVTPDVALLDSYVLTRAIEDRVHEAIRTRVTAAHNATSTQKFCGEHPHCVYCVQHCMSPCASQFWRMMECMKIVGPEGMSRHCEGEFETYANCISDNKWFFGRKEHFNDAAATVSQWAARKEREELQAKMRGLPLPSAKCT